MTNHNITHIGVFTSGGDSPGMNAAIYGVVKAANANGISVSGIRKGYEGMIDGDFLPLNVQDLKHHVHRGGTILKTARSQPLSLSEETALSKDCLLFPKYVSFHLLVFQGRLIMTLLELIIRWALTLLSIQPLKILTK